MAGEPQGPSAGEDDDVSDGAVRAEYDWSSTRPSTAVIETVATVVDREPTAIEPLHESVDPDALNALVRSSGGPTNADTVTVSFVFAEQRVRIHGTGELVVPSNEPDR